MSIEFSSHWLERAASGHSLASERAQGLCRGFTLQGDTHYRTNQHRLENENH